MFFVKLSIAKYNLLCFETEERSFESNDDTENIKCIETVFRRADILLKAFMEE